MIENLDCLGSARFMQRYVDRWCYFGSSSKTKSEQNQQQAQTSSNTIDPLQMQQYQDNLTGAKTAAASLTPYQGQLVAGFNPTQTQAQGIFSGIGTDQSGQSALRSAMGGVQGILGSQINGQINPQAVNSSMVSASPISGSSPVLFDPVTAGLLKNTDLSSYMNPYTKDVINASVDQNERARQMATVSDAQKATAAGAFGGSRSGVAASLTNGEYDRNSQANIANLNAANFGQAQNAAVGDINRTLGADQFNSSGILGANQFNANLGQQTKQFNAGQDYNAQIANQNAGINTGEFNSGQNVSVQQQSVNNGLAAAGLTLNAAGQIIPLSQASLADASSRAGILGAVGDQQQQQQQSELSAAYQAYTQGQQLTLAQQQLLSQALSMIPIQQTTNSSGTSSGTSNSQTSTNPGLGGILGGIGSLFSSVSALGGLGGLGGGNGLPGGLGAGSSGLGQMTGSNAVGYGGLFGAAAPQAQAFNIPFPSFNPSSVSLPRLS